MDEAHGAGTDGESGVDATSVGIGLALGAGPGVAFGAVVGSVTSDVGLWVALGTLLGAGVGLAAPCSSRRWSEGARRWEPVIPVAGARWSRGSAGALGEDFVVLLGIRRGDHPYDVVQEVELTVWMDDRLIICLAVRRLPKSILLISKFIPPHLPKLFIRF